MIKLTTGPGVFAYFNPSTINAVLPIDKASMMLTMGVATMVVVGDGLTYYVTEEPAEIAAAVLAADNGANLAGLVLSLAQIPGVADLVGELIGQLMKDHAEAKAKRP